MFLACRICFINGRHFGGRRIHMRYWFHSLASNTSSNTLCESFLVIMYSIDVAWPTFLFSRTTTGTATGKLLVNVFYNGVWVVFNALLDREATILITQLSGERELIRLGQVPDNKNMSCYTLYIRRVWMRRRFYEVCGLDDGAQSLPTWYFVPYWTYVLTVTGMYWHIYRYIVFESVLQRGVVCVTSLLSTANSYR